MLTIHAHQIQRLDDHFENELIASIRDHVATHFPDEFEEQLSHDKQNAIIRRALETGRSYDLTTDANLTIFTDFQLIFGASFPTDADWAMAILTNNELSEDDKTERLTAHLDSYIEADAT